jgi:predicted NBD/HSP70 family sugar kinase
MKEYNEKLLYNLIRTKGPISRAKLAQLTRLSPTSVGRIASYLLDEGYIREVGTVDGCVGRKAMLLDIIPEGVLGISVDINVPQIHVGLVNIRGEILSRRSKENSPHNTVEQILTLVKTAVDETLNTISDDLKKRIIGMGVSAVGPVDWPDGIVISSPQFNWKNVNVPLRLLLQNSYDFEVLVDNDTKSTAKAEQLFGGASKYNSFLSIYLGSGIGSTLSINGRIVRGDNNLAGEIGHMVVVPNGTLCDCGRRGCLQATACISGVERITGKKFEEVLELAAQGNVDCVTLLDQTATYLSQWIANMAVLFDPTKIIIYGEMLDLWESLYDQIAERFKLFLWTPEKHSQILRKSFIENAAIPFLSGAASVFYKFTNTDVTITD